MRSSAPDRDGKSTFRPRPIVVPFPAFLLAVFVFAATLLGLFAVALCGCGPTYLDAINCYEPNPVPPGSPLWDCWVCECDSEAPIHELVAAPDQGSALGCWEATLWKVGGITAATQFGCVYSTKVPDGQPNAADPGADS